MAPFLCKERVTEPGPRFSSQKRPKSTSYTADASSCPHHVSKHPLTFQDTV
jgi:hypothetical protein